MGDSLRAVLGLGDQASMWSAEAAHVPADQLPPLLTALEKLAPTAEDVTSVSLRHSLQAAAESFVYAEARRLGVDIPRPGEVHSDGRERS